MDFIINIIKESISFFNEFAIYLVFGFLIAGILHVIFPERFFLQYLGKNNWTSVLKATLFGIPLPLCSCGVIPVAASIRKKGASRGASLAFLVATPQIGTDSFMVTYSLIGWVFGIFRVVASFITAMTAGIITNLITSKDDSAVQADSTELSYSTFKQRLKGVFHYIQVELLGSFVNYLVIGILVAGAIAVFVPASFFETYLNNQFLSMILMLIIGIPMYVCATASTPIAASLLMKGLSPGAALVFLLVGPATNAITISTVFKTMGKKAVTIYLVSISLVSIGLGYLLNFLASYQNLQIMHVHHHEILPDWLTTLGSMILLAMIAGHYVYHYVISKFTIKEKKLMENQKVLTVNGMTCNHCAMTVKQAVMSVTGNEEVNVDLAQKKVFFKYSSENLGKIKQAITLRGYDVLENA